jgi:predicted  nucleic acid-binding Zn-ribbon protein
MNEEPTKDLATRAFQKRVLDEFAAVRREVAVIRSEQVAMQSDIAEIRSDILEIRTQQTAMAKNIAALDQRLTMLEKTVDDRLKETRPIWEAVQEQVQRLVEKFDIVLQELYDVRTDSKIYGRRIGELERRMLS